MTVGGQVALMVVETVSLFVVWVLRTGRGCAGLLLVDCARLREGLRIAATLHRVGCHLVS